MSRGYCHKASKRSRQSKPCEPISAIEFMPWGHTWWSCLKFHASLYQYIRFIFDPSVFDLHCTTYTYKLFWTLTHYVSSELQEQQQKIFLVFCYHNCSNKLWEKNVLVWGKKIESRKFCNVFEIHFSFQTQRTSFSTVS